MEILGIIPARGGSKGVPRKNIKLLAGEPLIAHTIREAKRSRYITRLVVSTEDQEIAQVARELGAEVPFVRPMELAMDDVTDLPVFQHCLHWLSKHQKYAPDIVVHLRPTAPLRTAMHIDRAIDLFIETPGVDCVRSVSPASEQPLKMWGVKEGYLEPYIPAEVYGIEEPYNLPRQKLPAAYIQNGAVDVIKPSVIRVKNSMTGGRIKALVMNVEDAVSIDTQLDWELAEILLARRSRGSAKRSEAPA
jgi:N-acylneuraminate cytidylyltransferase